MKRCCLTLHYFRRLSFVPLITTSSVAEVLPPGIMQDVFVQYTENTWIECSNIYDEMRRLCSNVDSKGPMWTRSIMMLPHLEAVHVVMVHVITC